MIEYTYPNIIDFNDTERDMLWNRLSENIDDPIPQKAMIFSYGNDTPENIKTIMRNLHCIVTGDEPTDSVSSYGFNMLMMALANLSQVELLSLFRDLLTE